jgi:hypothetical protein
MLFRNLTSSEFCNKNKLISIRGVGTTITDSGTGSHFINQQIREIQRMRSFFSKRKRQSNPTLKNKQTPWTVLASY